MFLRWLASLTSMSIIISKKSFFLIVKLIFDMFPLFFAIIVVILPKLPGWFFKTTEIRELDNIKFQIEEGEIEHEDWKIIEDEVIKQLSNDPNFNQENGKVIKFDFKKANNPKKVD